MTSQQINTLKLKSKVGEQLLWRRDVTKGWLRKKVISAFLITNYRVISPDGQQLYYEQIDDVVGVNTRRENIGDFQMFGSRGTFRYTMGKYKSNYITVADCHFLSSTHHDIIWYAVDDAPGLIKLVKSLKKQGAMQKYIAKQKHKINDDELEGLK